MACGVCIASQLLARVDAVRLNPHVTEFKTGLKSCTVVTPSAGTNTHSARLCQPHTSLVYVKARQDQVEKMHLRLADALRQTGEHHAKEKLQRKAANKRHRLAGDKKGGLQKMCMEASGDKHR